jgi:hypothetical protein
MITAIFSRASEDIIHLSKHFFPLDDLQQRREKTGSDHGAEEARKCDDDLWSNLLPSMRIILEGCP